jgi:hypothetical protein
VAVTVPTVGRIVSMATWNVAGALVLPALSTQVSE